MSLQHRLSAIHGDNQWDAQAVSADVKPCDVSASAHGTEPMPPLDGADPTPSVLQVLMQQAKTIEAMCRTIDSLTIQMQEQMDRLLGEDEEPEVEEGHGYDMAGNRVKVS